MGSKLISALASLKMSFTTRVALLTVNTHVVLFTIHHTRGFVYLVIMHYSFMFTSSLDSLVNSLDVSELVCLAVEPHATGLTLVGLGVGMNVLMVSQVFQGVEASMRFTNGALVRLNKK